jgi:hypothetical protein
VRLLTYGPSGIAHAGSIALAPTSAPLKTSAHGGGHNCKLTSGRETLAKVSYLNTAKSRRPTTLAIRSGARLGGQAGRWAGRQVGARASERAGERAGARVSGRAGGRADGRVCERRAAPAGDGQRWNVCGAHLPGCWAKQDLPGEFLPIQDLLSDFWARQDLPSENVVPMGLAGRASRAVGIISTVHPSEPKA